MEDAHLTVQEPNLRPRMKRSGRSQRQRVTLADRLMTSDREGRSLVHLAAEQPESKPESTGTMPKSFFNSLKGPRVKLKDILASIRVSGLSALTPRHELWLANRHTGLTDLEAWSTAVAAESASEALAHLKAATKKLPSYVLLSVLRKPTFARQDVFQMMQHFRQVLPEMDDCSVDQGFRLLLQRALVADASLLPDICQLAHHLRSSTQSNTTLGTILRLLAKNADRYRAQVSAREAALIIRETYRARLGSETLPHSDEVALARLGCRGARGRLLLIGSEKRLSVPFSKPAGRATLQTTTARYNGVQRDLILSRLKNVPTLDTGFALMDRLSLHAFDLVWTTMLARADCSPVVVQRCLSSISSGVLQPTLRLVAYMLRASKKDSVLLERILAVCRKHALHLDTRCAVELVRQLEPGAFQVFHTLVSSDAHILLKETCLDPSFWSHLFRQMNINRVKGKLTAEEHTALCDLFLGRMLQLGVAMTTPLLSALTDAALYGGAGGRWQDRWSLDQVTDWFKEHVNHGDSPGLLQAQQPLWYRYLRLLVAHEQVDLMERAVEAMLDTGIVPDNKSRTMFALGLWEAAELDRLGGWQERLEQEHAVAWPDQAQVFALKRDLERHRFALFRT